MASILDDGDLFSSLNDDGEDNDFLGDVDDDDEEEDDDGSSSGKVGSDDDDGGDDDDDDGSPNLAMLGGGAPPFDLDKMMFGVLVNPMAEPSLINGVASAPAATNESGGGGKTKKAKAGKKGGKEAESAAAAAPASDKKEKNKSKDKPKKNKKTKKKQQQQSEEDIEFDELMSTLGDDLELGSFGVDGGSDFGDDNLASAPAATSHVGPKTVAGANAFYGSYDMYPGEMQATMQERADLINLYEMLKKRGYVSQHDVPNLPIEDMRFEVFRLQRLDEMNDAVSDYKSWLIFIVNSFELFAPTIQAFTGIMFQGVGMRTHMAMERGEMTRAFQGIYHKRSKYGQLPPEVTLGLALLKCFGNVAMENYQAANAGQRLQMQVPMGGYQYQPQPQPQPVYYYTAPQPQPQPQPYYQYASQQMPQMQMQMQMPQQIQPEPQAPTHSPDDFGLYAEVRHPQLQQMQEQQQGKNESGIMGMVRGLFTGNAQAAAASQPHQQMQQQSPANPAQMGHVAPQYQVAPPPVSVEANQVRLKEILGKIASVPGNSN